MSTNKSCYDAIVVGAGHAGVEAGLALARLGHETLVLSITLDNVAYLACNPSIGGTAKGHLVREVDALGGEMGVAGRQNAYSAENVKPLQRRGGTFASCPSGQV